MGFIWSHCVFANYRTGKNMRFGMLVKFSMVLLIAFKMNSVGANSLLVYDEIVGHRSLWDYDSKNCQIQDINDGRKWMSALMDIKLVAGFGDHCGVDFRVDLNRIGIGWTDYLLGGRKVEDALVSCMYDKRTKEVFLGSHMKLKAAALKGGCDKKSYENALERVRIVFSSGIN